MGIELGVTREEKINPIHRSGEEGEGKVLTRGAALRRLGSS